ncbi:alpha/beta hydrolase [Ramlibacter sp. XY19]|uniref:alpha/beta hydrolase n=1 Tax=Ramlibacter paludis TaxID=2908000 RepID=UPI0023DBBB92|nr:alpha/beta family hydrolase [Ramlibacter paludis]MCG2595394.1 alpha/beta hydrolase [Ramlibacter paludis]
MTVPNHLADFPAGDAPVPALLFAPGQSYRMHRPIPVQLAQHVVPRGIAVFRFDWTAPGAEAADLRAMLAMLRSDPRVDVRNIWIGGKSLGSVMAWQLLADEPALRGAVLLTPICTPPDGDADGPYPGIDAERRPLLFLSGAEDRLCEPAALYRFAARAPGAVRVDVIAGGHDLGGEAGAELAGRLVADFLGSHCHHDEAHAASPHA